MQRDDAQRNGTEATAGVGRGELKSVTVLPLGGQIGNNIEMPKEVEGEVDVDDERDSDAERVGDYDATGSCNQSEKKFRKTTQI